jgi:hypothetical protein
MGGMVTACVWSEYARPNAIAGGEPQITIHVQENGVSVNSYRVWGRYETLFRSKKATPYSLSRNARQILKSSGTLLSFRTSVRVLQIGEAIYDRNIPEDALQTYYLLDSERVYIGKIWTCDIVARARVNHQFIALSSRKTGLALKGAVGKKYIPQSTDSEGSSSNKPIGDWKVINVMLVEWMGDVAFRVDVGQVISTAWDDKLTRSVYLG